MSNHKLGILNEVAKGLLHPEEALNLLAAPTEWENRSGNETMRDQFAVAAMCSLVPERSKIDIADEAYRTADAMMEARKR